MNVLYIDHYAGSETMGMEFRPYYMAKEWAKDGINTVILCANYAHLRKKNPIIKKDLETKLIDGAQYMFLTTRHYVGNGVPRLLSMFEFIGKGMLHADDIIKRFKPDVVICSSTYPLDTYIGQRIKKKTGALLIHEIHDLWPLSPMELGGFSKNHPFIRMLQAAEISAYKHSDYIVSILPNTEPYIRSLGAQTEVVNIPNGLTAAMFDEADAGQPDAAVRELVQRLKAEGKFIVGYAGGISVSNAMAVFMEAMAVLKDNDRVAAVVIGEGILKAELLAYQASHHLDNVHFVPAIEKHKVPATLKLMDALYIGSMKSKLYEYGVSANKIFDYMLVGAPIINAFDTKHSPMNYLGNTIECQAENPQAIAAGILKAMTLTEAEKTKIREESIQYVREHHHYNQLGKKFSDLFNKKEK